MSLTKADLTDIRGIVLDALDTVVNPRFDRIEAQLDEHSTVLAEHGRILAEHSEVLAEHGRRLVTIEEKVDNIDGRLRAIEADIKELYAFVGASPVVPFNKEFARLAPEQQLVKLYDAVTSLAKQLHVEL